MNKSVVMIIIVIGIIVVVAVLGFIVLASRNGPWLPTAS